MSDPWRVVLPDGRVMGVAVQQLSDGDWKSYCEERAYSGHGATPFLAVLDVMPFVVGDAESASEIVPPGEMTRAEAVAAERERCAAEVEFFACGLKEQLESVSGRPLKFFSKRADSVMWLINAANCVRKGVAYAWTGEHSKGDEG